MKHQIAELIANILKDLGVPEVQVEVTVPEDASHGDYTTNVAMKIWRSPQFSRPLDLALQVKDRIRNQESGIRNKEKDQKIRKSDQNASGKKAERNILSDIDHVEVAPPGFLNIFLTEARLISQMDRLLKSAEIDGKASLDNFPNSPSYFKRGVGGVTKRVMVEFAHPNTHKAFHIGHLRNITTGESIIRLLESQGSEVIRANYQGDVGMHIAKCLYGILQVQSSKFKVQSWKEAATLSVQKRVEYLGEMYAAGSKAFDEDPAAKEEIGEINKKLYAKDPVVYDLYQQTRQWSLDYFEAIYRRVGSHFDRYYFESEVYEPGEKLVRAGLAKGIFEESDGAIIFPGAKYGLHNRVFVTGEGNATYEGKELALATMETTEHGKLDRIIHVVGPEQASFFQVTFKAEELLGIVPPGVQHHLIYGWVKLKHGKMSSRSGNVVLGEWLLDEAKKAIYTILERTPSKDISSLSPLVPRSPLSPSQKDEIAEKAAVAAVKYAFLKVGTTSEIAFDIKESVNFQGDSGPYLQYTYARCKSVLRKANLGNAPQPPLKVRGGEGGVTGLNPEERAVLRLLTHFPDIVAEAARDFAPSTLCTYLFRLAQSFNFFYAKHQILGNQELGIRNQGKKKSAALGLHDSRFEIHDSAKLRLALTAATAQVLKNGLYLLGIETLEQM
ncbi:arginine--tRNA ligase [Candidatus Gottesmanbacteria bacterium]|nr:arginine--tRNA ligase [Candidatus Gottesmanbacteria bacterium]